MVGNVKVTREDWLILARNARLLVTNCTLPAADINAAVCNSFGCFIDPKLFDRGLDFAVREWARR